MSTGVQYQLVKHYKKAQHGTSQYNTTHQNSCGGHHLMSYDIDVYMRVSPHDIGEQWNRELARLGVSHRIPDDVIIEWRETRQWSGAIPVNENPIVSIEVYCDGRTPRSYALIDKPSFEKTKAEERLEGSQYVVNFTTSGNHSQIEWDAVWWCAAALTIAADGVLVDPQSEGDENEGLYAAEDVAAYAREQIAAWRESDQKYVRAESKRSDPAPPTLNTIIIFSMVLFGLVFAFAFNIMGWSAEQDGLRYLLMAGVIGLDILVTFVLVLRFRRKPPKQS